MRRRLALQAVAVTSLIVLSFVVPLGILASRQARDRALSVAEREAQSIATAIAVATSFSEPGVTTSTARSVFDAFGRPDDTSIHLADGQIIGIGSPDDPDVAVARGGSAFTAKTNDGAAVLIPILSGGQTAVVRVAVSQAQLSKGVKAAWSVLAGLAIALLGIAVFAADRLGRSVIDPVERLRSAAVALGTGDLATRVEPGGPPEIVEVAHTFNDLAERLGDLLQEEREAAADLSHGLRTPLTALRLQVEGMEGGHIRDGLLDDVSLVENAADRVIFEARTRGSDAPRRTDLAAITQARASFWEPLASDQERSMTTRLDATKLWVSATETDVTTILDTLIENVFAHTDPGTPFAISVTEDGTLTVADGGSGFEATSARRGRSGGGSTGLGLDIVGRIARHNDAHFDIGASSLGGAEVSIAFKLRP